ncbi:hypothetical protein [Lacticaseibacillus paracasei]|uniref:hypothetical protein n=1 Tax=Lacticaseibacillus paracasei TaxID=1597 RepID=UPI000515C8D3
MKKFWKTLLSALIIAISFGAFSTANQVDARVKFTRNADFYKNGQECQWSGQKLSGSAECVWLSLKFTHYQIFYQRLILFNVQERLQTSPGIWSFPRAVRLLKGYLCSC